MTELSKFIKGDKVIVTDSTNSHYKQTGIVDGFTRIDEYGEPYYCILLDNNTYYNTYCHFYESEIDFNTTKNKEGDYIYLNKLVDINNSKVTDKPEFSTGDTVVITNRNSYYYGKVGTVLKYNENKNNYSVLIKRSSDKLANPNNNYITCFYCDRSLSKIDLNSASCAIEDISKEELLKIRTLGMKKYVETMTKIVDAVNKKITDSMPYFNPVSYDQYLLMNLSDENYDLMSKANSIIFNEKACKNTTYGLQNSIRDVIFSEPATIVFWTDGTKTVVKAQNEPYDPEKGLALCIAKKYLGNDRDYYITIKHWLKKYEKKLKKKKAEDTKELENITNECSKELAPSNDGCYYYRYNSDNKTYF